MRTELDLRELGDRLKMVDQHIVALLAQRMELARQVERYKRHRGQPIIRFEVEDDRLNKIAGLARERGLNPNFLFSLFYSIIAESCRVQINQMQIEPVVVEDISLQQLKDNLLSLTKEIAPLYDQSYGQDFFATKLYLELEESTFKREIGTLKGLDNLDLAVDLGCATGKITFKLAESFRRVIGYDISEAMIQEARNKLGRGSYSNVEFKVADIDEGILEENESVSLAVMNLGTASDVTNLRRVLAGIRRILKPNGRFILSFYNSSALLYKCWFIPWPVSLAASINHVKHCLDVRLKDKVFSIHARPHNVKEVQGLIRQAGLKVSEILTYPTISSILPNEFFEEEGMQKIIADIDRQLIAKESGAYILVTGRS